MRKSRENTHFDFAIDLHEQHNAGYQHSTANFNLISIVSLIFISVILVEKLYSGAHEFAYDYIASHYLADNFKALDHVVNDDQKYLFHAACRLQCYRQLRSCQLQRLSS